MTKSIDGEMFGGTVPIADFERMERALDLSNAELAALRQERDSLKHELQLADDEISDYSDYKCRLDAEKAKSRILSDFAERDSLQRQVKIAVEALEVYTRSMVSAKSGYLHGVAEKALSEIAALKEAKSERMSINE